MLGVLLSTTLVVTAALGWAGWRLLNQQRGLDEQRGRDRAESAADALAAGIRGRLAEAGERLSAWVANPSSSVPAIDAAVVVGVNGDDIVVNPAGGLPFVPVPIPSAGIPAVLTAIEPTEFTGDARQAIARYTRLAGHPNHQIRAGALLRLGRVQRKLGDRAGALRTYQQLTALGTVRTDNLPAELAGLTGQYATFVAMSERRNAEAVGQRILQGLDGGRWQVERGVAQLYRDLFAATRPDAWHLAEALGEAWANGLSARGQRLVTGSARSAVLVVWRSSGAAGAALAAPTARFFELPPTPGIEWQLSDPEGLVVSGSAGSPATAVARIIGNAEYPWTLRAWVEPAAMAAGSRSSRSVLAAMLGAMLVFVWGTAYFMARAIRREAAVARLQSDFVAAVSHEFRSPLTTVRQLAEMLDQGRVPTPERRGTYYRLLAAEAARLQRLVETLLQFGRLESGSARYQFADVDAVALVRDVVDEIAPRAREAGKAIEFDGAGPITVHADQDALSLALRNLVDNAIKYSPDEDTVWVRCRRQSDRAAISVVDRGVGIARSEQRSIFDKFVRGHTAMERNIKGTGLGLSMVQRIVAAHGGEIQLESEPGRGSTFTVLLPSVH